MLIEALVRDALLTLCAALLASDAFAVDAAASAPKKQSPQEVSKTLPTDEAANAEVDALFKRWSSAWMFDRYLPGSARTTERGLKDETYVVRGLFDFARSGTKLTIPYAAAYTKTQGRYTLSNLCYNDTSSGMTDCINPSASLDDQRAAVMQSRQFLGSIVLLGLVAAISEGETCVKRYTLFGEPYLECE
jgi:hypothetical protein